MSSDFIQPPLLHAVQQRLSFPKAYPPRTRTFSGRVTHRPRAMRWEGPTPRKCRRDTAAHLEADGRFLSVFPAGTAPQHDALNTWAGTEHKPGRWQDRSGNHQILHRTTRVKTNNVTNNSIHRM